MDFEKPTAEDVFKVILLNPEKYEEETPLKNVRENKLYTIRNQTLESITCDDNGAYNKSNGNKRSFYVELKDDGLTAKIVHQKNEKYFYKEKDGRTYDDVEVPAENVYVIERYYRWNKSIKNLKRTIFRVKTKNEYEPFLCVIYSLHDSSDIVQEIEILPHGNTKRPQATQQPYIRTEKSILQRQEELLFQKNTPQEVYDIVLKESGGSMSASSVSKEPRNLKQIQNLQAKINKDDRKSSPNSGKNLLDDLLQLQRDKSSIVKTVSVTGEKFIAFAYTESKYLTFKNIVVNHPKLLSLL